MAHDAFTLLHTIADRRDLFGTASAQVETALGLIVVAAVSEADGESLPAIHDALGSEAFATLIKKLKPAQITTVIDRIDGLKTETLSTKSALARLKAIARGVNDQPLPDFLTIDLSNLQLAFKMLGLEFEVWLTKQGAKAKPVLQRLDPGFPGVAKITASNAKLRLTALAQGAMPVPVFRLPDLDAVGLRQAHAELGDYFEPWLMSYKGPGLKDALMRIDPLRPKVDKLKRDEYSLYLRNIAEGGSLFVADRDASRPGERQVPVRSDRN